MIGGWTYSKSFEDARNAFRRGAEVVVKHRASQAGPCCGWFDFRLLTSEGGPYMYRYRAIPAEHVVVDAPAIPAAAADLVYRVIGRPSDKAPAKTTERGGWVYCQGEDAVQRAAHTKERWSIAPWRALGSVVRLMTKASGKHGDIAYKDDAPGRDGLDFDAAMRHAAAYVLHGDKPDAESGEHPLAHAAARLMMIVERHARKADK